MNRKGYRDTIHGVENVEYNKGILAKGWLHGVEMRIIVFKIYFVTKQNQSTAPKRGRKLSYSTTVIGILLTTIDDGLCDFYFTIFQIHTYTINVFNNDYMDNARNSDSSRRVLTRKNLHNAWSLEGVYI